MTLKISMVLSGDAAGATKALADTTRAMDAASAEAAELKRAYDQANGAIAKLADTQAVASREIAAAKAAYKAGETSLEQYNRAVLETKGALGLIQGEHRKAMTSLQRASVAFDGATKATNDNAKSSQLAGHHMTNLGFQVQDLGLQLAAAAQSANPLQAAMMAFAQQGTQIAGIAAQANTSVMGLMGSFVKGHPVLLAAGVAVGALIGGFALLASEINKSSDVTVTWQDVALGAFDAIKASVEEKLVAAFQFFGISVDDVWGKVLSATQWTADRIFGLMSLVPRLIIQSYDKFPGAIAEVFVSAFNYGIGAINDFLKLATAGLNGFITNANLILGMFGKSLPAVVAPHLDPLNNVFAGSGAKLGNAMLGAFTDTFTRGFIADGAAALSPFAQARARKRTADDAEKAGKAAGGAMGRAGGKQAGEDFTKAFDAALAGFYEAYNDQVRAMNAEMGRVYAEGEKQFSDALHEAAQIDPVSDAVREAAQAQVEWNDRIAETVALLNGLGGTAGKLGALFAGLTTGDFSGVGGKGGALLQYLSGISWRKDDGTATSIGLELKEIFGPDGPFGQTLGKVMSNVFQGAGVGASIGSIAFGSKGGQLGSTIGGGLGQALGTEVLGKALGSFAGPIGAIAGSIIGGLLGGALSSTKRGSATFDAGGLVSTRGNSQSRIGGATKAGNSALDAFNAILDELGASASNISFSTGIRKKSFVLDPSGQGRTKGAGVLNFGQDEEAFLKATLQEMISDATFSGLSEGFQKLLKGGDIEAQLQKVMTLKGALDDYRQRKDGQAFDLSELDKEFAKLRAIATEAGEGLAEIEELYGMRRKEIVDKYAAEALEKERDRRELEIAIMAAQGDTAGALAASRALELQATEAGLVPLKERLWQLQDEAELAAKAKAIADERYAIDTQILQLQGDEAALRARALELIDPANRARQQELWALADLKAETEAATRAMEEAAAKTKAVADERYNLDTQYLQLVGDEAALRARALELIDPANRARQQEIWALADLKAETEAATRAMEEAAAKTKAVADERYNLDTQYLQLVGDEAALRARALELIDPANRARQQEIWALQDAKDAAEEAARAEQDRASRIADARKTLIDVYTGELSALADTASRMRDFARSIREFRDGVIAAGAPASYSLAQARARFESVSRMASVGSPAALGDFSQAGRAFLDAARGQAGSSAEYREAMALVARGAGQAIRSAEGMASAAELQAQASREQLAELIRLNDSTDVVAAAIARLEAVQVDELAPAIADTLAGAIDTLTRANSDLRTELAATRQASAAAETRMVSALEEMLTMMRRSWGGDHYRVGNDADTPLTVVSA